MLFKVYLQNDDSSVKTIRQFTIDSPKQVKKKIKKMFLELSPNDDFTISWKDTNNDLITASSEEELQCAFTGTKGSLYVKVISPKQKRCPLIQNMTHFAVTCDNCYNVIIGFRYKCIECADYDLCAQCEARGVHWDHFMIRIAKPLQRPLPLPFNEYLGEILKNNYVYCNKKIPSDRCTSQDIDPLWSNICKPFLKNLTDGWMTKHIDSHLSKKTEKETNMSKEKKLTDNSKGNKESVADNTSNTTQDESVRKVVTDEWTIIDKNDTAEVTQACSTSSNTKETAEVNEACSVSSNVDTTANQACSTSFSVDETDEEKISSSSSIPNATEESLSTQTLYHQLPKEEKVVHHQNPIINEVVETMIKMGFSHQGGLLSYLLEDENGDINKVLEILQAKSG